MKTILQGMAGIVLVLVLIGMVGLVVYQTFFKKPECATEYVVPDPGLLSLVLVMDLDKQGVLSEVDKDRILKGNVDSVWVYDGNKLIFSSILNGRHFSAEMCITEETTEFKNLMEIISTNE